MKEKIEKLNRRKATKKRTKQFKTMLKTATCEKDVENAYRAILHDVYVDDFTSVSSPHNCDGYFSNSMFLRLLLEAKHEKDFYKKTIQCETLLQALYYIKQFSESGESLPNVIFCADKNEAFVVSGSVLYGYLNEDIDWSIAPSASAKNNSPIIMKMVEDMNISPFVFAINNNFEFEDVCELIDAIAIRGAFVKLDVTEHNLRRIYDDFLRTVIIKESDYTTNQLVTIFIQSMTNPENCYLVPTKKNMLHLPNGSEIKVYGPACYAFFSQFNRNYSTTDLLSFSSIADRLLVETDRRFQGSFWTPSIWADRANEMMEESLGEDYRNKYIVWDPCCGSLNLTRDYDYRELYASTLFEEELELGEQYNSKSTKFQYDFLNDDIEINPTTQVADLKKIPVDLFDALKEDKPIIFYANPPYATANNSGAKGTAKTGVASKTKINDLMKKEDAGKASQQLYAQFIWRILKIKKDFNLTNVVIAFFVKPNFLASNEYYKKFRDRFFSEFVFLKGNLFNASEFDSCSNKWGITFSIFKSQQNAINPELWKLGIEETYENGIRKIGEKYFRVFSKEEACSAWIREPVQNVQDEPLLYPQFSSAFNVNEKDTCSGNLKKGSIGYLVNVANNIYKSENDVFILSGAAYMGHGVAVLDENFERVCSNYAARKLSIKNWITDKDEFHIPNTKDIRYAEWTTDSVVYAVFGPASYQTSLRNVEYKGNTFNVQNQWFWMSRSEIRELADSPKHINKEVGFDEYNDRTGERFVSRYLATKKAEGAVSKEAQAVIAVASKIVRVTFEFRNNYDQENEEICINTWDAGWVQIKKLLSFQPDLKKEFDVAMKVLTTKMEPLVYELRFLEK